MANKVKEKFRIKSENLLEYLRSHGISIRRLAAGTSYSERHVRTGIKNKEMTSDLINEILRFLEKRYWDWLVEDSPHRLCNIPILYNITMGPKKEYPTNHLSSGTVCVVDRLYVTVSAETDISARDKAIQFAEDHHLRMDILRCSELKIPEKEK